MADVEVYGAETSGGRVTSLKVRYKNTDVRTIDRETALRWLADGHSLITYAGHPPHHCHRGEAVMRVEVGDEAFLRTDTKAEPTDHLVFPGEHGDHGHGGHGQT